MNLYPNIIYKFVIFVSLSSPAFEAISSPDVFGISFGMKALEARKILNDRDFKITDDFPSFLVAEKNNCPQSSGDTSCIDITLNFAILNESIEDTETSHPDAPVYKISVEQRFKSGPYHAEWKNKLEELMGPLIHSQTNEFKLLTDDYNGRWVRYYQLINGDLDQYSDVINHVSERGHASLDMMLERNCEPKLQVVTVQADEKESDSGKWIVNIHSIEYVDYQLACRFNKYFKEQIKSRSEKKADLIKLN